MRIIRYAHYLLILIVLILTVAQVQTPSYAQDTQAVAPTYTIYATREGLVGNVTSNGHIVQPRDRFVALPSMDALCSYHGYEYQVRITYNGRSVVAPVWDTGPWNTNDDYWSPNRRYSDLPVGVPMAQAAYLEGYNGGLDSFGRRIALPNGIDIADGTFWDDLGMVESDWVQVSFLWLGSDPGPGNAANVLPPPDQGNQEIPPVMPATDWGGQAPYNPGDQSQPQPQPQPQPVDVPILDEGMIAADNGSESYSAAQATWYQLGCGVNGGHEWTYSTSDSAHSENHAIWQPPSTLEPGTYEIKAYIPSCGSVPATRSARYRITHQNKISEVVVDQQASAGTWATLGTYTYDGQTDHRVELNDITSDSMQAIHFDAIVWTDEDDDLAEATSEPVSDTTPPSSQIIAIEQEWTGFRVRWDGTDDISGIASYDVQFRRIPEGVWRTWITETTDTEAWFGPAENKQFAFRVRARDQAGNGEEWEQKMGMDTTHIEQP